MSQLTIVVPTFNERGNCRELVSQVEKNMSGINWEILFVDDDSPDGTIQEIKEIAATNIRVKFLHRIGMRGLASACIDGVQACCSQYIVVVDGDLQHDLAKIPVMLHCMQSENLELVVASRYLLPGGTPTWKRSRLRLSQLGVFLSKKILKIELTDPMSGFFLISREAFNRALPHLSGLGFKVLLDIYLSLAPTLKVKEIPFQFRNRMFGKSKLNFNVLWAYLRLLSVKLLYK